MKSLGAVASGALLFGAVASLSIFAQTIAPTPNKPASEAAQLQELTKKIDEQNAKIDMLSQQILKLQLQITEHRPGVMIGEGAPPSTSSSASSSSPASPSSPGTSPSASVSNGNSHVVARGETLTSIAKMYGVSVSDLQKFNHIDNPLKLMAGQTLQIPPSTSPSPSAPGE